VQHSLKMVRVVTKILICFGICNLYIGIEQLKRSVVLVLFSICFL